MSPAPNFRKVGVNSVDELFYSKDAIAESFAHLYAHKRSDRALNKIDPAGLSFNDFARNFEEYRNIIFSQVESGAYQLSPAQPTEIFADKPRIIQRLTWPDNFVLLHLARSINQVTASKLPDCLFSYRKGRSASQALKRLGRFIGRRQPPFFIARRDIKSYGETMDHKFILADFARYASPGPQLCHLMKQICEFPTLVDGQITPNECGLPTGNYLQLVFENLYLLDVDKTLSVIPNSLYLRFGDDILFVSVDGATFDVATKLLDKLITNRLVSCSPEKSKDILLVKPHELSKLINQQHVSAQSTFCYLGMQIDFKSRISLPKNKQHRLRQSIRARLGQFSKLIPANLNAEGRVKLLAQATREYLWEDSPEQAPTIHDYLLAFQDKESSAEFDRWLALTLLGYALGTGHKASSLRKFPYRKLRELGLPSCTAIWRQDVQP